MNQRLSLISDDALADLLDLARATPPGHFAEFGVYKGGSALELNRLAIAQGRELWLFDTFTGMPLSGADDPHPVGDFADTSEAAVRALVPEAIIVAGIFPASMEAHERQPQALSFVHVDADQYESLTAAVRVFPPLMVSGGVMLFDDYGCLPGATKAVRDWGEPITTTRHGKAVWRKP